MRLLPRTEKFLHLFCDHAVLIEEAARLLVEGSRSDRQGMEKAAVAIRELEHQGDKIIHDIYVRLNQTFITPIDPEDIHLLSSRLDDVLDGIEDGAYSMAAYRLDPVPPAIVQLCEIIHQSARAITEAMRALEKNSPVIESCVEINRLENAADELLRTSLAELFENEKDPIRLIKCKEVYEFLEATTDRCEDVADVVQNVLVKNS